MDKQLFLWNSEPGWREERRRSARMIEGSQSYRPLTDEVGGRSNCVESTSSWPTSGHHLTHANLSLRNILNRDLSPFKL